MLLQNTVYTINVDAGIEDLAGNALGAGITRTFTTQVNNSGNPNAMIVSSMSVGVPCVLINANGTAPGDAGECYNIDHDIYKFSKFLLPLNRNIEVHFTKPVNPVTVTAVSFVVKEKVSGIDVVGSRILGYKSVTFIPNNPWIVGTEYELRLVGGANTLCDAGEICGSDNMPLNTNILNDTGGGGNEGISNEQAGGQDIVIPFIGSAYNPDIGLGLPLIRFSDTNGNGVRDTSAPAEPAFAENSAVLTALGLVDLTTYLSGTLLATVQGYDNANSWMPLEVGVGNWLLGTEMYFSLLVTIDTDRAIIRPADKATGNIRSPAPADADQRPIIELTMNAWMNAVNDTNGEAYLQDEPDTEFVTLTINGRIDFTSDGRMVAVLTNPNDITGIELDLPILGSTNAVISAGNLDVRAVTVPVRQ